MLYGKYRFLCRLETDAVLPYYKGSTFRGVFGHALKKVVCALKLQECRHCLLKNRCVYALVFETSESFALPEGSKISNPPHPYVIEPPLTPKTDYQKGASFDFNLLLFGEINNSLPYFIYAFHRVGKLGIGKKINGSRGKFTLKAVSLDNKSIYTDSDQKLHNTGSLISLTIPKLNQNHKSLRLKLTLQTPLRVKFENRLKADLPFHILVRTMLRRISSLLICYSAGEPDLDYKGLVRRAEAVRVTESDLKWFDWKRYSQRQDQNMLMGGMVGSITYEGRVGEYLPLIDFCSTVHLGKQTSFGLGKISMERLT